MGCAEDQECHHTPRHWREDIATISYERFCAVWLADCCRSSVAKSHVQVDDLLAVDQSVAQCSSQLLEQECKQSERLSLTENYVISSSGDALVTIRAGLFGSGRLERWHFCWSSGAYRQHAECFADAEDCNSEVYTVACCLYVHCNMVVNNMLPMQHAPARSTAFSCVYPNSALALTSTTRAATQ